MKMAAFHNNSQPGTQGGKVWQGGASSKIKRHLSRCIYECPAIHTNKVEKDDRETTADGPAGVPALRALFGASVLPTVLTPYPFSGIKGLLECEIGEIPPRIS